MQSSGATDDPDGAQIVRRVLEAFNRRDADALLDLLTPDARFESMTGQFAREGEPYIGRSGLLDYLADADRLWPGLRVEVTQVQAAGEAVVVIGWVHMRPRAEDVRLPAVWTWRLRDGLVCECVVHSDERAARQALGLEDV